jgi:hypothetical protein
LTAGPADFTEFRDWWNSFQHEPNLKYEIEPFFELVVPNLARLEPNFPDATSIQFNLVPWRTDQLRLCKAMLEKFPIIWTTEGVVFRHDVFESIETSFSWTYFHKAGMAIEN